MKRKKTLGVCLVLQDVKMQGPMPVEHLAFDSSFLLMHILRGSSDVLGDWISSVWKAQIEFLAPNFCSVFWNVIGHSGEVAPCFSVHLSNFQKLNWQPSLYSLNFIELFIYLFYLKYLLYIFQQCKSMQDNLFDWSYGNESSF